MFQDRELQIEAAQIFVLSMWLVGYTFEEEGYWQILHFQVVENDSMVRFEHYIAKFLQSAPKVSLDKKSADTRTEDWH